jgi:hypothetical protein
MDVQKMVLSGPTEDHACVYSDPDSGVVFIVHDLESAPSQRLEAQ